MKHTYKRLRLFQVGDHLEFLCPATEDGESILSITHEGNTAFAVVLSDMNARHLVACWNACEGIDTEYLEGDDSLPHYARRLMAQRDELLAALQEADKDFEREGFGEESPYRAPIRAAIAKAEGESISS